MKHSLPSRIIKAALILTALFLLLAGTVLTNSAGGSTTIYPYVIGGGGGHLQADIYTLDATIGQPVVGQVVNPPYDLCAGFWCGLGRYKILLPLILRN